MLRKLTLFFAALAAALPANARGLRFHCFVTGSRDQPACCCTGSTTEACGAGAHRAEPKGCGS